MENFKHLNVEEIKEWNIKNSSKQSNSGKDNPISNSGVRTVLRKVTFDDFIMPEYRGKNPEDYEFREDGKIVRKDRWENGIHRIHTLLINAGLMAKDPEFEIDDVVNAVRSILPQQQEDSEDATS